MPWVLTMPDEKKSVTATSNPSEIEDFVERMGSTPRRGPQNGRLIFALDATASRQVTWNLASRIQGQMFRSAASLNSLEVQLCYYRGFRECRASRWLTSASNLEQAMQKISCMGGQTQILRVLKHTLAEHKQQRVNALAFVGDCIEENIDQLCNEAGKLGLQGVPVFLFHEGPDERAYAGFKEIARLSGGACFRFDSSSVEHLKNLLAGVAIYASGGMDALKNESRTKPALAHIMKQLESS